MDERDNIYYIFITDLIGLIDPENMDIATKIKSMSFRYTEIYRDIGKPNFGLNVVAAISNSR